MYAEYSKESTFSVFLRMAGWQSKIQHCKKQKGTTPSGNDLLGMYSNNQTM